MILSAIFSKPTNKCEQLLGKPYLKIRIWKNSNAGLKINSGYEAEFFTKTQSFRKKMTDDEFENFISEHAGKTFKSVVQQTEDEEITILSNRHGEIKSIHHPKKNLQPINKGGDRKKNYILQDGIPVPFLVKLGVMSPEGKVVAQKYDKFKQINRFLEFIKDIIPDVKKLAAKEKGVELNEVFSKDSPLHIADFGCGKSYLTFAVYYYLTVIEKINVEITGLDLKADVIQKCSSLAKELNYEGLHFYIGDVAKFSYSHKPDIVITLHACDTATDYALDFAIKNNSKAILSVPCCQHEINLQLDKKAALKNESPLSSITKFGILRERLSALATDAIRGELLEQQGYAVQILEFIDMEHTPKNLLIRAIRKSNENVSEKNISNSVTRTNALMHELDINQTLASLLSKN